MKVNPASAIAGLFLAVVAPVFAHHSFAAEFDAEKPIKVTGVISKVEWANPHIWFYVDVKDASGNIATWGFEGGPPSQMVKRGIAKNTLKLGDTVTVLGYRAKDGSNNASGHDVTFADGRKMFTGAVGNGGPPE